MNFFFILIINSVNLWYPLLSTIKKGIQNVQNRDKFISGTFS